MNIKNKLFLSIIIVFIVINSVFLFSRLKTKNEYNNIDYNFLYFTQKQISKIEHSCEFSTITPHFYYGTDTCNTHAFKDIDSQVFIFYFSIQACQPCLDIIVDSIRNIFSDFQDKSNILFMSDDLEFRLRDNFYNKKITNIKNEASSLLFIKNKIPTLFMLDTQTMKIHNIFVCNKETPDYLGDYLHIIKKRYFHNSN